MKIVSPAADDESMSKNGETSGPLDPRIRRIAQAIGRHIAREHIQEWAEKTKGQSDTR